MKSLKQPDLLSIRIRKRRTKPEVSGRKEIVNINQEMKYSPPPEKKPIEKIDEGMNCFLKK